MPVTYQVNPGTSVLRTICAGKVTFEDVLGHFEELASDDSLPARLDLLLDLCRQETAPSGAQIRDLADRLARMRDDINWGRCAVLVSRDVLFGIGRMFGVHTDSLFDESRVFREAEEAEAWLSRDRMRAGQ
jgi:hypothetical protein